MTWAERFLRGIFLAVMEVAAKRPERLKSLDCDW